MEVIVTEETKENVFIPEEEIKTLLTIDVDDFKNNKDNRILLTWDLPEILEDKELKRYNVFVFTNIVDDKKDLYIDEIKSGFERSFLYEPRWNNIGDISSRESDFEKKLTMADRDYLYRDNINPIILMSRYPVIFGNISIMGFYFGEVIVSLLISRFRNFIIEKYRYCKNDEFNNGKIIYETKRFFRELFLNRLLLNEIDDNFIHNVFNNVIELRITRSNYNTIMSFNENNNIISLETWGAKWKNMM